MESYTLHGGGDLTRGAGFTDDLLLHRRSGFPGARSHSLVSDDSFYSRVTSDWTAMLAAIKLFATDEATRGAISKVTPVGDLTRVMTYWGFPARVVTPGRAGDLLLSTGHSNTRSFTKAGDLNGQWTRVAGPSVASAGTLVVFTAQQFTTDLFTTGAVSITAFSFALVFIAVTHG